jgi:hypothetical protein
MLKELQLRQRFVLMKLLANQVHLKFLLVLILLIQRKFILLIQKFARAEPLSIISTKIEGLAYMMIQSTALHQLHSVHLLDGVVINGSLLQNQSLQIQESVITMLRAHGSSLKILEVTRLLP